MAENKRYLLGIIEGGKGVFWVYSRIMPKI
jgi:hypothetical protein